MMTRLRVPTSGTGPATADDIGGFGSVGQILGRIVNLIPGAPDSVAWIPAPPVPAFGMPGAVTPGDAAAVGAATTFANSAHQHAVPAFGMPGAVTPGAAAAVGAATTFANSAHQHAVSAFGMPVNIGDANAIGSGPGFAANDHVHAPANSATSRITFAPGTRNVIIYTVGGPAGAGRLLLTRCLVRVASQLTGTGSIVFSIGSSSGGTQIILPVTITSVTAIGVVAGELFPSLGSAMLPTQGYEAVFSFGQNIWGNVTATGLVTGGYLDVYLYAQYLSS